MLPIVEDLVLIGIVTLAISTMLWNGAVTQPFAAEQLPAEIRETGPKTVQTASAVIGSTEPVIFGVVADRGFSTKDVWLLQ